MPKAGPSDHCLNCGAPIKGAYCSACGQSAADFRLSFIEMAADFIDSQFNLNSKLLTSLRLLLTRPGFLTIEYNIGKRVRYITPLRLYLIASALFFVVAATSDGRGDTASPASILPTASGESSLQPNPGMTFTDETGATPVWLTDPNHPIGRLITQRIQRVKVLGDSAFEHLLEEGMLTNIPKMMFVLLPIFAFLLHLLYRHTPFLYVEHLNFTLHYHTVVFVVFIFLSLTSRVMPSTLEPVTTLITVLGFLALQVYIVFALHTVYGQTWRRTVAKYLLLFTSYTSLLLIALTLTALITFFSV